MDHSITQNPGASPFGKDDRPTHLPLYVAVNSGCNLRCFYCTEYGESRDSTRGQLPLHELIRILGIAYDVGFRQFRFTGGEPTLRGDFPELLCAAQALGSDVRIAITTNGVRLNHVLPALEVLKSPKVFLSVDGIEALPAVGRHPIEKVLTPGLRASIETIPANVELRFNFVLTRANAPQLPALVTYCEPRRINIKLFELLLRDFAYTGGAASLDEWREQYLSVRELIANNHQIFGAPKAFEGLGGRGIPMQSVEYGGIKIIFFDSASGAHYHKRCRQCPRMPCQEGMYAPILSARGAAHPSACTNTAFHYPVAFHPRDEIHRAFQTLRTLIEESEMTSLIPSYLADHLHRPESEPHAISLPIV